MPYNDVQARKDAEEMGMQVYYLYFLKKGPAWSPDSTPEIDALQEAHLANFRRLYEEGKMYINGPFLDSFHLIGDLRGAGVLKADSWEEAHELINTDPMVKAGRLVYELHAWMLKKDALA